MTPNKELNKTVSSHQRPKGFFSLPLTLLVLGAIGVVLLATVLGYHWNYGPNRGNPYREKDFVLSNKPGALGQLFKDLKKEKIIPNETFLRLLARGTGMDKKAKQGYYVFNNHKGAWHLLRTLAKGKETLKPFLIREGDDLYEIALLLYEKKLVQHPKDAITFFHSPACIQEIETRFHVQNIPNAEGFLYPDTYMIRHRETLSNLFDEILNTFEKKIFASYQTNQATSETSMPFYPTLIIASLIEEESAYRPERPLIASVISNRLQKKMPLQLCVTLVYALKQKHFLKGTLLKHMSMRVLEKHFHLETPYNTYLHAGLPPGPITSPSLNAFQAACSPQKTPYYYFVARKDGSKSHQFSRTYREHLQKIRRSQQHPSGQ